MNKRVVGISIGVVILLLVIAGYRYIITKKNQTPESESNSLIEEINIAQWGDEKYLIYLPLYVADYYDIYEKHGVSVNFTYVGNDQDVSAAIREKKAHVGIGDPAFIAINNSLSPAKDKRLLLLDLLVSKVALWGVADSLGVSTGLINMESPDLTYSTFPKPSTAYTVVSDLVKQGKFGSSKSILQTRVGGEAGVLKGKSADIAFTLEPSASQLEMQNFKILSSLPTIYGDFAFTGEIINSEDFILSPMKYKKFKLAVREASRIISRNSDSTFIVASSLFPKLNESVIKSSVSRLAADKVFYSPSVNIQNAWNKALIVRSNVGDYDYLSLGFQQESLSPALMNDN